MACFQQYNLVFWGLNVDHSSPLALNSDPTERAIDYRHNAWGNVIGEEHLHNGLNYDYVYDDLHRLTFQTVSSSDFPTYDRDIDYDYDAVGNPLFKTDYADTIYYGNSSKSLGGNAGPHAVRSLITVDGNTHTLVYDNAGNLLTGIGMKVEYDGYNQANKVERNGVVSEYWYNTEGKPYKKITTREHESETTLYIGGSYELITTDDGSSATESERLNYGGYFVVNKSEENTERRILLTDRLGSVTTIVDADKQPGESGFIKQYRSYDPFGQVRNFQGADDLSEFEITDQGFTGHRHLNDQELIHMNGRVYDYQLGRFLSPDPIILDPKNSQSLNAYNYIMNNPLWGTDPTGYYPDKGDTGQGVNTRSKSEASPTDEEGIASKRSVSKGDTGRTYKPVGSRIQRKVTATAKVDGNGNVTLSYSAGTTKLGSYKISGLMSNSVSGNSVSEMTGVGSGQSVNAASTGALPLGVVGSLLNAGARFLTSLIGMSTLLTSSSYDNPDDYITVYRGTDLRSEIEIQKETGLIMSDAARNYYQEKIGEKVWSGEEVTSRMRMETAAKAGVVAVRRHAELVAMYGGEENLARIQTGEGTEFPSPPRSMFSVTTDLSVARRFARGGAVYMQRVNRNKLIETPVNGSESEYFIRAQTMMERIE
ncbi:hypothetical protein BTJ40_10800 [Microbulbifer sp. A4B17]|uniref:RHS repeat-associated core domain-containing protein n=1 Tax=Microbulbifer sp. A4B17 TaxID=359370 RepID=UPI000D52DE38|nr:RHS repeat-associated core domain-containing protein [Microbulbifer sp. A4B17]AWF81268.1 hypothetical protein BTJ40_10800 [Microbulbifer sp. A4B17]